jgi:hypothetical protein
MNIFILPPVMFIEKTQSPLHLKRGTLFSVHGSNFSVGYRLRNPVKVTAATP